MTNAELLAKIKAEIERRKKSLRAGICNEEVFTKKQRIEMLVASEELGRLNRFLSTLESEKPIILDGLEEELDKWRHKHFHGKRDDHFSGEYLERTSQLDPATLPNGRRRR